MFPNGRPVYSQTAIYASGVGLGASKGKEVGKYQEGYAGYVNMVKDSVSLLKAGCTSTAQLLTRCIPGTRAIRELSMLCRRDICNAVFVTCTPYILLVHLLG